MTLKLVPLSIPTKALSEKQLIKILKAFLKEVFRLIENCVQSKQVDNRNFHAGSKGLVKSMSTKPGRHLNTAEGVEQNYNPD